MNCPNCGLEYNPDGLHFCTAANAAVAPPKIDSEPVSSPHFVAFVSAFTLFLLFGAAATFLFVFGWERDRPTIALVAVCGAAAIVSLAVFAKSAFGFSRKFVEARRLALFNIAFIFLVIFFGGAWKTGSILGSYQSHFDRMREHTRNAQRLGQKITAVRQKWDEVSIDQYLDICKTIEPDVTAWRNEIDSADSEWTFYGETYPERVSIAQASHRYFDAGRRRAQILRDQIAVSRQIASLPESDRQAAWQSQMQPLLDKEDALDAELRAK